METSSTVRSATKILHDDEVLAIHKMKAISANFSASDNSTFSTLVGSVRLTRNNSLRILYFPTIRKPSRGSESAMPFRLNPSPPPNNAFWAKIDILPSAPIRKIVGEKLSVT